MANCTGKKLNVTFENGKTIIDGIPSILYLNSSNHGVGQLFNGEKVITGLQKVSIQADTDTFISQDLRIMVKRNDQKEGEPLDLHRDVDSDRKDTDGV